MPLYTIYSIEIEQAGSEEPLIRCNGLEGKDFPGPKEALDVWQKKRGTVLIPLAVVEQDLTTVGHNFSKNKEAVIRAGVPWPPYRRPPGYIAGLAQGLRPEANNPAPYFNAKEAWAITAMMCEGQTGARK